MSQNLQNFAKFQKFQFENLVDFEKCCKTHIFLQKSEPIQPKTSNILQVNMRLIAFFKIYQILKLKFLKFDKILQILRHLQKFW